MMNIMIAEEPASARLRELVSRRWDRLDWGSEIPAGFVIPEAHYHQPLAAMGLSEAQRVGLNRLMACFTCELVVHFEAYVIRYIERYADRIGGVSRAVLERFVAEEVIHSEAFLKVLHRLRSDLYPGDPGGLDGLRFMRWSWRDDLALRVSPVGTFFLLAWLFEEITLHVQPVMDAHPEQSASLFYEVIALHAREERSHVAIDDRILVLLTEELPRWRVALEAVWTLPVLAHVDAQVAAGWRRLMALADRELGLSSAQREVLARRGATASDRAGIARFNEMLGARSLAGGGVLRWALAQQLR